jgi:thiol-disulfide isomerase/thioredoxin
VTGPAKTRPSRWARQVIGPFTVRHLAVLAVTLAIAALLLGLLTTPLTAPPTSDPIQPGSGFYRFGDPVEGLAVGQPAPELEGVVDGRTTSLLDLDGRPVTLAAQRGRPVWLSFFATWCPPCQEEMPVLREAHERYAPRGLEMISVSVQETTADDVAAWVATYAIPYTIGFDASSAVFHTYRGFGLPTHVFIDADGIVRGLRYGPMDREAVAAAIEPLLAQPGRGSNGSPAPPETSPLD